MGGRPPWASLARPGGSLADPLREYDDYGGISDHFEDYYAGGSGGMMGSPSGYEGHRHDGYGGPGDSRLADELEASKRGLHDPLARTSEAQGGEGPPGPKLPSAWVSIGIAGGLLAPVLEIFRTGGVCQPRRELVEVIWPAASSSRASAVVFVADGPVAERASTQRIGDLVPPAAGGSTRRPAPKSGKGKKGAAGQTPAEHELWLTLRLSHRCELTVQARADAAGGAGRASDSAEPLLAAELWEPGASVGLRHDQAQGQLQSALQAAILARGQGRSTSLASPSGDPGVGSGAIQAAEPIDALIAGQAKLQGSDSSSWAGSALSHAGDDPELTAGYRTIMRAQSFDGSFDLGGVPGGAGAAAGLHATLLDDLAEAWTHGASALGLGRAVAHTATALAALSSWHGTSQGSWALVAAKAKTWLGSVPAKAVKCGATVADCIEAAELAVARWRR